MDTVEVGPDTPAEVADAALAFSQEIDREYSELSYETEDNEDELAFDRRVNWLLRRSGEIISEINRAKALVAAEKGVLSDWMDGERARLGGALSWIHRQLEGMSPPDGATMKRFYGKKSRSLPYGTYGFRVTPLKVEIEDKAAALAFAVANGVDVETVESVKVAALKKHIKATGLIPTLDDGVIVTEPTERFFTKPTEVTDG